MMWCPAVDDVLRMHEKIIVRTGGASGLRSLPLIESAIQRFYASFGGQDAHTGIEEKAAAVMCGLIQNHGFVDGNKRIGVAVMRLILVQNSVDIQYLQAELVNIALAVAEGRSDVADVSEWIRLHTVH